MPPGNIYARVFQDAQTGLLLLERTTGRVVEANAVFVRMAARGGDDIVGRCFWQPPLVADPDAGAEVHAHLLAGGTVASAELPFQTGDGRWLLLDLSARALNGGLVLIEVRDATGDEQARLAARIEALRLIAGRTAAEFHRLHRSLVATGELLLVGAGQGRPVLRELEEIQQASERAGNIARQLEAFGGGIQLQLQPVALNDLVESTFPRLRQMFGRGIEIVPDLSPDTPYVMADSVLVRQALLKLAANSRDAMGPEGTFCVQTNKASAVEPGLGTAEPCSGSYGMLAVSDSGPGLDDLSWAHLYEPFFTSKATGLNLGLGLAAVYGIVRKSGGRLWAYSQPGNGATFRIYLPSAGAQFPALPAMPAQSSRDGAIILLVEANDGMRTVMANLLKKRGYRVLAALHPKEAMRIAETHGPPDLLISRPEPELAHHLTRIQPQLQVLYLGGLADGLLAREHGLPPRTSLLQKPFEPETLLARVLELLD